MNDTIFTVVQELCNTIISSPFVSCKDIENINGVYIFYEDNKPMYVGRTNRKRMKLRIQEHYRPSANKHSATFALKLAQKEKREPISHTYDEYFVAAKERVGEMQIKKLEEDRNFHQLLLEAYIAYKYQIPYFESDTH